MARTTFEVDLAFIGHLKNKFLITKLSYYKPN